LSSRGGHPTKLLTPQDGIELIMVLPGKMAKETRGKFANVLQRYMAGDESLIGEIRANALSNSPIAQLARGSTSAAAGSSLGKRASEPSLDLIRVEFKKSNDSILAVVTTNNTQTNEKMDKINEQTMERMDTINEKNMERMDTSDAKLDEMNGEVVAVKETVVTLVDNKKELSALTAMMKASALKAKQCEHTSFVARGEAGAKASKKYKLVRKELAAEKLKNEILTRQRADSDRRIQQLEAGQADLKTGQADLKTAQAVLQADLKAGQADLKAGQAVLQADIKAGQVEMMAFLRNTRPSL